VARLLPALAPPAAPSAEPVADVREQAREAEPSPSALEARAAPGGGSESAFAAAIQEPSGAAAESRAGPVTTPPPDPRSPMPAAQAVAQAPASAGARDKLIPQAPAAARPLQQQQQQQGGKRLAAPTGMAVRWLGTSSGAPTQHRNVSSILLLHRDDVHLVDCGEGTRQQLLRASIDPLNIRR
jgi:hypothetical protein